MPIYLRQSTASQEIPLGYFLDSTNGDDEETGLTIANTDIKIWKTGATTLANKNSGGATHISNGIYYAVLDATDTNTIGPLVVFCHPTGALATRTECVVLDEAVYDVLFGTTAPSTLTTAEVLTQAQTALNEAYTDATSLNSGGIKERLRRMTWFVANKWDVDETATPDTLTIFKDDGTTAGLSFEVYTSSSHNYRAPV